MRFYDALLALRSCPFNNVTLFSRTVGAAPGWRKSVVSSYFAYLSI